MRVKVVDLGDSAKTLVFNAPSSRGNSITVVNTGATSVRIGGQDLTSGANGLTLAPGDQVQADVPYGDLTYAIGPGQLTIPYA